MSSTSEHIAHGRYLIWLDETVVNNLGRLRGHGEDDLS
jgi:hypothetical protein